MIAAFSGALLAERLFFLFEHFSNGLGDDSFGNHVQCHTQVDEITERQPFGLPLIWGFLRRLRFIRALAAGASGYRRTARASTLNPLSNRLFSKSSTAFLSCATRIFSSMNSSHSWRNSTFFSFYAST